MPQSPPYPVAETAHNVGRPDPPDAYWSVDQSVAVADRSHEQEHVGWVQVSAAPDKTASAANSAAMAFSSSGLPLPITLPLNTAAEKSGCLHSRFARRASLRLKRSYDSPAYPAYPQIAAEQSPKITDVVCKSMVMVIRLF